MPKMGGLELCSRIKKDVTYSHILVVVLSANLTQETQIACMEVGADALVEKPFSMEFLLSRVGNLLQSRKRLIERLSTAGAAVPPAPADNPSGLSVRSSLLLDQVNAVIRANLSDPEFGIEQLSEELGISTSTLGRKLKDLLDTSAGNYIRDKRLEKAEELLRNSTLQVNEICYQVGFQTPSYFIKCFRRKYGSSPNEYAKSAQ
jgi:AraC-like DNA-binding protein